MIGMELFPERAYQKRGSGSLADAPLAERMRPQALEDFVGQEHLLGPGGPLGPLVSGTGRLPSMILWGPPGSGKTTLGALLAYRAQHRFEALSAVMAGVKDLREAVARAGEARAAGQADGALRGRDPPLQQGAAGRAAAVRRERHDRR